MKRMYSLNASPVVIGLLVVLAMITAACSYSAVAQNQTGATPSAAVEIVKIFDSGQFGQILMTSGGMALYNNTVDKPDDLRCTSLACTSFWSPYVVGEAPAAPEGISGTLGTVTRPDGSLQLIYNQMPVYTFYLDAQPGEVKGDGFADLGGTWHVVSLVISAGGSDSSSGTPGGIRY